jgi:2-oxoglutarate dehydrogenase E2 component (dihydrolipoamide succinyltransferase)
MPKPLLMPQFGESVVEGTITKWLKSVGDSVEEYEPLVEVNTDKVDTEIASPTSGVLLEILAEPGVVAHTGTVLAWIGAKGEAIPEGAASTAGQAASAAAGKPPEAKAQSASAQTSTLPSTAKSQTSGDGGKSKSESISGSPVSIAPTPGRTRDLGFISPVVARIASEHNVDLFQVQGTGQGGRITKEDVLKYIETGAQVTPAEPSVASPSPHPPTTISPESAAPRTPIAESQDLIPMTPVRKAIAEHMVMSERTSPHVTTVMEIDMSKVVAHRQANKAAFERAGANLTYTAYFIAASATALKEQPIVNSSFSDQGIVLHRQINIGMATSLGEEGLIVPVIKNAGDLSLLGLAKAINDLATRARARKLNPDEVRGGTFTITNHGTTGSLFATPIINQPQCAILGVGMIQKRVVVITDSAGNDALAIRPMVYVSLTFDHRVLDGAIADVFLGKVVQSLQNWT